MNRKNGISRIYCIFSISILFVFSSRSLAQQVEEITPKGSRSNALGSSYVALTDFWSSLNNPANLTFSNATFQAGIFYENSYLIKELNQTTIGGTYASKFLNVGLYISRFGITSYNQGVASLAFGKKIWKGISIGGKICYHYIQVAENYGSVAAFTGEVGINAQISKELLVGIHIVNPTNESIGNEVKEPLPASLAIGISYTSPWGISIFSDIENQTNKKAAIHTGIEWNILKRLHARSGFRSSPNILSIGVGYSANLLTFDFTITKHNTLGYSPQVSVTILFNNKNT